jgi:hypothetical protein
MPCLLGWGHRTAPLAFDTKIAESRGNPYVLPHTRQAIVDAFRRAGLADCWQLAGIETHDCFTTSEYMAIDHFGLTAPGESWKAIEEGVIDFGGKLPINPSGGLIGAGHPVGATGVRQVVDAALQVTGRAGDDQVPGARRFATLNIGGSGTTSCVFVVGACTLWLALQVAGSVHWAVTSAPRDGRTPKTGGAREIGVGFLDANGYVVAFELAAVVLTVALVAAVYIARRKRSDLVTAAAGPGGRRV